MELFLKVDVQILDAENSGIPKDEYSNPEELIYCFCERDLQFSNLGSVYYHVENCKGVFYYLDEIEHRIPKEEKTICWNWGGVRQGTQYYVNIHFIETTETIYSIDETLNAVFDNQLSIVDEFEIPSIDRDYEEDGYEWHEGRYDDDSHLRVVEECTFGRKWVEWERPYPETEGCALGAFLTVVGHIASIITVVVSYDQIKIKIKEKYFAWIIHRLTRIVRRKTGHKGTIQAPEPMPPRCYDGATGRKEYLFYQYLDDGRERKIFISKDGKKIKKLPFTNGNEV